MAIGLASPQALLHNMLLPKTVVSCTQSMVAHSMHIGIISPCKPKTALAPKETSCAPKPNCARKGAPSGMLCASLGRLDPGALPQTSVQIEQAGLNHRLDVTVARVIKTSDHSYYFKGSGRESSVNIFLGSFFHRATRQAPAAVANASFSQAP